MEGQKSRSKALQTAVGVSGVESAALTGQEKNQIEVVGEGIDSVVLVKLLRKNIGSTDLVSVAPVEEKKENGTTGDEKKNEVTVQQPVVWAYPYASSVPRYACVRDIGYDRNCSIMGVQGRRCEFGEVEGLEKKFGSESTV